MLKTRIIPTLLWKNVGLVKGKAFNSWRRVGSILPAIKVYNTREVDELIVLDITATADSRDPDYEWVSDFSYECFVPLTVGGGINSVDQIKRLLRSGADKVAINTGAFLNPMFIEESAKQFGSQCIVISIDAKKKENGDYECYSHSGVAPTGIEVKLWAKEMEERGAGEILITSVDRDGTMQGYDLELINLVTSVVKIPVIASGGAGEYHHFYEAIANSRANAVAAASMFHFTQSTPKEAKEYLSEKGISVRTI
jgi:imidazole glycerol-phosphate synthase subunit HisF